MSMVTWSLLQMTVVILLTLSLWGEPTRRRVMACTACGVAMAMLIDTVVRVLT